MLTPTDIQYLVGLLSLASSPEKVEVELGTMVYDVASKSSRDVDVTLRVEENSGGHSAYKGIEVKDHSRPLGTEHIEQLAAKLNDMPALSHRAIVSASGYTKPSVRKAEAKGIKLFELCDWNDRASTFPHFGAELVPSFVRALNWVEHVNVTFSAAGPQRGIHIPIEASTSVRIAGVTNPACPDARTLCRNLQASSAQELRRRAEISSLPVNQRVNARVKVVLSDRPALLTATGEIIVESATITGTVEWTEVAHDTIYKILIPHGGGAPLAGCAISELPGFGLCGMSISADRRLSFIHVPISERNRKKIYRRPILQGPDSTFDVAS